MPDLASIGWPIRRAAEAMEALARAHGLPVRSSSSAESPSQRESTNEADVRARVEGLAASLGLEAVSVDTPLSEIDRMLASAAPALVRLPGPGSTRFIALARGGRRSLTVLAPGGGTRRIRLAQLSDALSEPLCAPVRERMRPVLDAASVAPGRRAGAEGRLASALLAGVHVGGVFILRVPVGGDMRSQARRLGLGAQLAALVVVHAAQYFLWIASWWIIGKAALGGQLEVGWLIAWSLLLLTMVPVRSLGTWLGGRVSIGAGLLLKQRLLVGALRMPQDEVRRRGAGELLGQVLESEAVETLALTGGLNALTGVVELAVAVAVLGMGAGGGLQAALPLVWMLVLAALGRRYLRCRREWTDARLAMSHDLIERVLGQRTRVAQLARDRWHDGEDEALERYLESSRKMDRTSALLSAVGARGWLIVGVLGLAPAFLAGSHPGLLAVGVGGVILGLRALQRVVSAGQHLVGAAIAWERVERLWRAAMDSERPPSLVATAATSRNGNGEEHGPVLSARGIVFRHEGRARPTLKGVDISLASHDRVLLEGPSGSGKSTLAAVLAGLRAPQAGLLLLGGLDVQALGAEAWRRRVAAAPQFHENHVLSETFAFNLLMGRGWPPSPADLEEAAELCRELGLGELLGRMPAGMFQMVGETGWQLSHGERSRLFLARALLQRSDVVILDESFAALDPENLRSCMAAAEARADTLLVIAHP